MLSSITTALLATAVLASETEFGPRGPRGPRGPVIQEEPVRQAPIARGDLKQKRRRPAAPVSTLFEPQPVVKSTRKSGKYYDWRDYEPDKYDGKDPYADCVFPENSDHLDTAEYQALSGLCKTELIWQKVLRDERRERFYRGFEFNSLFDQDMN